MFDEVARFALVILLSAAALAVGLLYANPPASFLAIGLAVAAILACPSPP
jgi:hypothetical protein